MSDSMTNIDCWNGKHGEFFRFCCVGSLCAFVDWLCFTASCTIFPYRVSVVIGFVISLIINYVLTAKWTFKKKYTKKNFINMICAHLINIIIVRMGLLYILIDLLTIAEYWAYIPTLMISAVTSFIMVRYAFKH